MVGKVLDQESENRRLNTTQGLLVTRYVTCSWLSELSGSLFHHLKNENNYYVFRLLDD